MQIDPRGDLVTILHKEVHCNAALLRMADSLIDAGYRKVIPCKHCVEWDPTAAVFAREGYCQIWGRDTQEEDYCWLAEKEAKE